MRLNPLTRTAMATIGTAAVLGMSACAGSSSPAEKAAENVDGPPTVINAIEGETTQDCDGRSILLNVSDSQVDLLGTCGTVTISGVDSVVYVEDAATIAINGSGVTVTYGGDPEVSINGVDSTATPA